MFSLLRSQLCQRSTSHLLLSLSLLEIVLEAAKPFRRFSAPAAPAAPLQLPAVPEEGEPAQPSGTASAQPTQDADTNMDGASLSKCL